MATERTQQEVATQREQASDRRVSTLNLWAERGRVAGFVVLGGFFVYHSLGTLVELIAVSEEKSGSSTSWIASGVVMLWSLCGPLALFLAARRVSFQRWYGLCAVSAVIGACFTLLPLMGLTVSPSAGPWAPHLVAAAPALATAVVWFLSGRAFNANAPAAATPQNLVAA